jgi:hypothetical protein
LLTIFEGEVAVRGLLIKYVTLQLLSDAAFCLERWTIKAVDCQGLRITTKVSLDWLWRLWDIYVASHINTKNFCATLEQVVMEPP